MSSEANSPGDNSEPAKGLPPVKAPSGRHIVQLFVVPGLIVAVAVTILLGFSWLSGGSRSPQKLLENIQSENPDIRWRAANDLAQVLKKDDTLASDPSFGLRIAEQLKKALVELDRLEKDQADLAGDASSKEKTRARNQLLAQEHYVQYLAACLGNMTVPVGAPLLIDLARNGRGKDDMIRVLVRRQAVWALANLGAGQKRYAKLSDERKAEIHRKLEQEAESSSSDTASWAKIALAYLEHKKPLGVIETLADCSREDRDIFLREQVAHALTFWEGEGAEKELAEQTLLRLARDTGYGERIVIKESE
ncbi:MAG TPA: hypothetical protein VGZ47_20420 [Gemmataceae bacterium]|nr:hypothetical protein [Gemmataceae bacterium]